MLDLWRVGGGVVLARRIGRLDYVGNDTGGDVLGKMMIGLLWIHGFMDS